MDFHGKSGHSIGLARMTKFSGPTRASGFYMVPRPDTYRPWWTREDGTLDTERYLEFYDTFIKEIYPDEDFVMDLLMESDTLSLMYYLDRDFSGIHNEVIETEEVEI
jgi:hypothetical protein